MVINDYWRHFYFLCSVWGVHFLRSPGHFRLSNSFSSAEVHSIPCLSISLPMVRCILEVLGGLGFSVSSSKSFKILKGYFGGKQDRGGFLQCTVERRNLIFNFFGLNSYSTVACDGSVLNLVTKVYTFSFLNPRISSCIASVEEHLTFQPKVE